MKFRLTFFKILSLIAIICFKSIAFGDDPIDIGEFTVTVTADPNSVSNNSTLGTLGGLLVGADDNFMIELSTNESTTGGGGGGSTITNSCNGTGLQGNSGVSAQERANQLGRVERISRCMMQSTVCSLQIGQRAIGRLNQLKQNNRIFSHSEFMCRQSSNGDIFFVAAETTRSNSNPSFMPKIDFYGGYFDEPVDFQVKAFLHELGHACENGIPGGGVDIESFQQGILNNCVETPIGQQCLQLP